VVEGIVAIDRYEAIITGFANHSAPRRSRSVTMRCLQGRT